MSASRARPIRPVPDREGPLRNPAVGVGGSVGAAVDQTLQTAGRMAELSAAAVRDTVDYGVRTAYAVIDEYMRRGQEAAERYSTPSPGRSDMSDYRYTSYEGPTGPMMWGPFWPFVAPWMQIMQAWAGAMSSAFPAPGVPWGPSGMRPSPRVCVRVSSKAPIEVTPMIMPGADAMSLVIDPLQKESDSGTLPLDAVRINSVPGRVDISVTIPDKQSAGVYRGAIRQVGTARFQAGELIVRVEQAADTA